jgi:hypothetical protein
VFGVGSREHTVTGTPWGLSVYDPCLSLMVDTSADVMSLSYVFKPCLSGMFTRRMQSVPCSHPSIRLRAEAVAWLCVIVWSPH